MPTQYVDIKEIQGFVTNLDVAKAPGTVALDMRGVRNFSAGKVMQRDWGTRNTLSVASLAQVTTTPAPDQKIKHGFFLYNPDTGLDHLILMTVDISSPDSTHFWIETTGAANGAGTFAELTQVYTYTIASVANKVVTFTAALDTADDSLNGWIAINNDNALGTVTGTQFIEDSVKRATLPSGTDGTITVGSHVGDYGIAPWAAGNTVSIYRSIAVCPNTKAYPTAWYTSDNGTDDQEQHLDYLVTESQAKALILYGNVVEADTNLVTPNRPFYVKYESARGLFYASASALITRPAGWWADQAGDPAPKLNSLSTVNAPLYSYQRYDGAYVESDTMYLYGFNKTTAWGAIDWYWGGYGTSLVAANAGFKYDFHKVVVTLTLDGYGETDPVGEAVFVALPRNEATPAADGTNVQWTVVYPGYIYVNPAMMPRNLTAINIYTSRGFTAADQWNNPGEAVKVWANDNSRMRLNQSISLIAQNTSKKTLANVDWANDTATAFPYKITFAYATWQDVAEESTVAIDAALGRAPRIEDEDVALKPRFALRASRQQGSVVAVDESDDTIRLSVVDGYGVSADQIFPEVPYDINNRVQRIELTGHGSIYGMALNNDQAVIIKRSEIEFVDLQSNLSTIVQADCISKKSIVETPFGVAWAGDAAIYFLERGEPRMPKVLNAGWQNRYNGQELIPGTNTAYITQAYRKLVIGGYDPFYQELWFHVQQNTSSSSEYLCYRYSFQGKNWSIREINLGSAVAANFFTISGRNEFSIGISNQILYYPNRDFSAFPFEDGVVNDGDGTFTSAGYGVPTWIKYNLGAFDTISDIQTVSDLMIDHEGSVTSGTIPEVTIDIYADRETTAFDTKTLTITDDAVRRKFEPRGSAQNYQLKISLPSTDSELIKIQQFDVNLIQIGVIPRGQRTGNA